RNRTETRRLLGVTDERPLVCVSFGAYSIDVPLEFVARSGAFTLGPFTREPPPGLKYQDVVAAADVVISKPGYGIISECVANDTALLYTSRGEFIEYDVFVAEMPRVLKAGFIDHDDLFAGRWTQHLNALLAQPAPPDQPAVDGAEVAAGRLLTMI